MKLPHRRHVLHLTAGVAALPAISRIARAQAYPTRPVRVIVGFTPGGAPDILARLMGQGANNSLSKTDQVPAGTEVVVRASADGYTLLMVGAFNAVNATLYDNLNFNFIRDIAPVAGIVRTPLVMVVPPSFPAKTVPEFIAYAKANPRRVNMASPGNGTMPQVAAVRLLCAYVPATYLYAYAYEAR